MLKFEEYKNLIDKSLTSYIPSVNEYAKTITSSMEYSLTIGGKRLRPVLLLASCDFAGGNIQEALPYGCAIEYIHTYSLIHDDLPSMDNDDLRRGKPTNHKVYGEAMAVLAGDGLLNTATELMYSELNKHLSDDKLSNHAKAGYEIVKRSGINGMIGGQVVDVENENSAGTNEMVRYIEEHKTADLITAPILAGLYLAGADDNTIIDFRNYGINLGIAFQILDDILDFEGDEKLMGKTLGKDLAQDKCNYVCVNGLDNAKSELHRLTQEAISSISKYDNAEFFIELAKSMETRTN